MLKILEKVWNKEQSNCPKHSVFTKYSERIENKVKHTFQNTIQRVKNKIRLLIITGNENWHYLSVKNIFRLLQRITLNDKC